MEANDGKKSELVKEVENRLETVFHIKVDLGEINDRQRIYILDNILYAYDFSWHDNSLPTLIGSHRNLNKPPDAEEGTVQDGLISKTALSNIRGWLTRLGVGYLVPKGTRLAEESKFVHLVSTLMDKVEQTHGAVKIKAQVRHIVKKRNMDLVKHRGVAVVQAAAGHSAASASAAAGSASSLRSSEPDSSVESELPHASAPRASSKRTTAMEQNQLAYSQLPNSPGEAKMDAVEIELHKTSRTAMEVRRDDQEAPRLAKVVPSTAETLEHKNLIPTGRRQLPRTPAVKAGNRDSSSPSIQVSRDHQHALNVTYSVNNSSPSNANAMKPMESDKEENLEDTLNNMETDVPPAVVLCHSKKPLFKSPPLRRRSTPKGQHSSNPKVMLIKEPFEDLDDWEIKMDRGGENRRSSLPVNPSRSPEVKSFHDSFVAFLDQARLSGQGRAEEGQQASEEDALPNSHDDNHSNRDSGSQVRKYYLKGNNSKHENESKVNNKDSSCLELVDRRATQIRRHEDDLEDILGGANHQGIDSEDLPLKRRANKKLNISKTRQRDHDDSTSIGRKKFETSSQGGIDGPIKRLDQNGVGKALEGKQGSFTKTKKQPGSKDGICNDTDSVSAGKSVNVSLKSATALDGGTEQRNLWQPTQENSIKTEKDETSVVYGDLQSGVGHQELDGEDVPLKRRFDKRLNISKTRRKGQDDSTSFGSKKFKTSSGEGIDSPIKHLDQNGVGEAQEGKQGSCAKTKKQPENKDGFGKNNDSVSTGKSITDSAKGAADPDGAIEQRDLWQPTQENHRERVNDRDEEQRLTPTASTEICQESAMQPSLGTEYQKKRGRRKSKPEIIFDDKFQSEPGQLPCRPATPSEDSLLPVKRSRPTHTNEIMPSQVCHVLPAVREMSPFAFDDVSEEGPSYSRNSALQPLEKKVKVIKREITKDPQVETVRKEPHPGSEGPRKRFTIKREILKGVVEEGHKAMECEGRHQESIKESGLKVGKVSENSDETKSLTVRKTIGSVVLKAKRTLSGDSWEIKKTWPERDIGGGLEGSQEDKASVNENCSLKTDPIFREDRPAVPDSSTTWQGAQVAGNDLRGEEQSAINASENLKDINEGQSKTGAMTGDSMQVQADNPFAVNNSKRGRKKRLPAPRTAEEELFSGGRTSDSPPRFIQKSSLEASCEEAEASVPTVVRKESTKRRGRPPKILKNAGPMESHSSIDRNPGQMSSASGLAQVSSMNEDNSDLNVSISTGKLTKRRGRPPRVMKPGFTGEHLSATQNKLGASSSSTSIQECHSDAFGRDNNRVDASVRVEKGPTKQKGRPPVKQGPIKRRSAVANQTQLEANPSSSGPTQDSQTEEDADENTSMPRPSAERASLKRRGRPPKVAKDEQIEGQSSLGAHRNPAETNHPESVQSSHLEATLVNVSASMPASKGLAKQRGRPPKAMKERPAESVESGKNNQVEASFSSQPIQDSQPEETSEDVINSVQDSLPEKGPPVKRRGRVPKMAKDDLLKENRSLSSQDKADADHGVGSSRHPEEISEDAAPKIAANARLGTSSVETIPEESSIRSKAWKLKRGPPRKKAELNQSRADEKGQLLDSLAPQVGRKGFGRTGQSESMEASMATDHEVSFNPAVVQEWSLDGTQGPSVSTSADQSVPPKVAAKRRGRPPRAMKEAPRKATGNRSGVEALGAGPPKPEGPLEAESVLDAVGKGRIESSSAANDATVPAKRKGRPPKNTSLTQGGTLDKTVLEELPSWGQDGPITAKLSDDVYRTPKRGRPAKASVASQGSVQADSGSLHSLVTDEVVRPLSKPDPEGAQNQELQQASSGEFLVKDQVYKTPAFNPGHRKRGAGRKGSLHQD